MQHGNMHVMPATMFQSTRLSLLPNLNKTGSGRASKWDIKGELTCSDNLACKKIWHV